MSLNIYLNFDGTCAEAFAFYGDVFGSGPVVVMKLSDGPPEFESDKNEADKIMRMSLPVGSSVLIGTDVANGYGEPQTPATCFSINFAASSREDADKKSPRLGGWWQREVANAGDVLEVILLNGDRPVRGKLDDHLRYVCK